MLPSWEQVVTYVGSAVWRDYIGSGMLRMVTSCSGK
jgi:hypothetical protein